MRESLNNNPLVQVVVLGVLLLVAGFVLLSTMGGGSNEAEEATTTSGSATAAAPEGAVAVAASAGGAPPAATAPAPPPAALAGAAPAPPQAVRSAFASGHTVVLLFVRDGGIDDRLVAGATRRLGSLPGVAPFVIPAHRIARYARITEGVEVSRVPALVVIRPKRLDQRIPTASVHYGFQSPESVIDAGYSGPSVDYHP
jgi:hypothetical protein